MEFTEDIRNKEKPNSIFEDMYRYPELARILGIPRFIIERYPWGASALNNMLQLKDVDVSLLGYPGFNYPILISEKFKEVYRDKLYLEIRNTAKDGSVKKGSMIECIAEFINFSYTEKSELYDAQVLRQLSNQFINLHPDILSKSIEELKSEFKHITCHSGIEQWYKDREFTTYRGQLIKDGISVVISDSFRKTKEGLEKWSTIDLVISKEELRKLGITPIHTINVPRIKIN